MILIRPAAPCDLDGFVERFFEQTPTPLDHTSVLPPPPLDSASTFSLICQAFAIPGEQVKRRLFLPGEVLDPPPESLHPHPSDGDLAPWLDRIQAVTDAPGIGFELVDVHTCSPALYRWARAFTDRLIPRVGLPAGGVELSIYGGRYTGQSGFGIHRDEASVFHFPIWRWADTTFWPQAWGEAHPEWLDNTEVLKTCPPGLLDGATGPYRVGGPGPEGRVSAGLYWPSALYHQVAASGPNASLSMGFWFHRDGDQPPPPERLIPWPEGVTDLQIVAEQMQARLQPDRQGLASLARRLTGGGFDQRPPIPSPRPLSPDAHVAPGVAPLVVLEVTELDELFLAADGTACPIPGHPGLRACLQTIRAGRHRVADLLTAHSGEALIDGDTVVLPPETLATVLAQLVAMGALREDG